MEQSLYIHGYMLGYLRKQAGTLAVTAANEMNGSQDMIAAPNLPKPVQPPPHPKGLPAETMRHQTMEPGMETMREPDSAPL